MASKSKQKGNRFERECVDIAIEKGLSSKRAWGSDGRSMGQNEQVDLMVEKYKVQCKVTQNTLTMYYNDGGNGTGGSMVVMEIAV